MKRCLIFSLILSLICFSAIAEISQKPLKLPLGSQIDYSDELSVGLIGWWRFAEGMGNRVYDQTANNNPGTLNGFDFPASATSGWGPGKFGRTLQYDNVGDFISIGDLDIFDFGQTDGFTAMAWVRSTQPGLAVRPILSKYTNVSTPGWYLMETFTGGVPQLTFTTLLPVSEIRVNWRYDWQVWYHVAAVKDTTTDTVKMYVNGLLAGSSVDLNAGGHANATPLYIGKLTTNYYQGQIDDVRMYNRPLTEAQIKMIFNNPNRPLMRSFTAIWASIVKAGAATGQVIIIH